MGSASLTCHLFLLGAGGGEPRRKGRGWEGGCGLKVGWSHGGLKKGQRMNQKGDYRRGLWASKPGPLPRKSPVEERR